VLVFFGSFTTFILTLNTNIKLAMFVCRDQYKCLFEEKCISKSWVCDNITDCIFSDDETNCNETTSCPGVTCDLGTTCLDEWRICDNHTDCFDGMDEQNCSCDWSISYG